MVFIKFALHELTFQCWLVGWELMALVIKLGHTVKGNSLNINLQIRLICLCSQRVHIHCLLCAHW